MKLGTAIKHCRPELETRMKKRAEHKAWWLHLWTCRIKQRGPLLTTTTSSAYSTSSNNISAPSDDKIQAIPEELRRGRMTRGVGDNSL